MWILSAIKTMFGRKKTAPEVTLETFSNLPLFQMLREKTPFDDWRSPNAEIPPDLESSFKIYVWMYQMYIFHLLTAKCCGYLIAETVLKMQAETPKKVPEIGGELEVGIRQVQKYVAKQVNAPHVEERKGEKFEMPIELGVALGFLVDGKNAPFYVDPQEDQTGDVPEMNGADFALAKCLEHGKHSARPYFSKAVFRLGEIMKTNQQTRADNIAIANDPVQFARWVFKNEIESFAEGDLALCPDEEQCKQLQITPEQREACRREYSVLRALNACIFVKNNLPSSYFAEFRNVLCSATADLFGLPTEGRDEVREAIDSYLGEMDREDHSGFSLKYLNRVYPGNPSHELMMISGLAVLALGVGGFEEVRDGYCRLKFDLPFKTLGGIEKVLGA